MSSIEIAIDIALNAHVAQVDKSGEPYILHPLRVMLAQKTDVARIVAVLHDVAEDCPDGWQEIHRGRFSDEIIEAIDAVTRRSGEGYFDFIKRCRANPIARAVKEADIQDNLRPATDERAQSREKRYRNALAVLRYGKPLPEKEHIATVNMDWPEER